MGNIYLLDCTLRDGGYINDWRFGETDIINIFERLVDANVDIIEIGFMDDRRPFDKDRTIFPDTAAGAKIYSGLDKKNALIVGMVDYGTCSIENIQPYEQSFLDGIRVIFKKGKMYPAMEFCKQVKNLGYKVFAQLVSVTSYTDEELLEVIGLVNDVNPFAVSMVDTYGLLDRNSLLHIYEILEKYVDKQIKIGFHAHNNLQLGYANAMAFLEYPSVHDKIVDGTLYGMGKSAGNDPIELVAMTLNEKYNGKYHIDSMLEAIGESVINIYQEKPWGYNLFFYLCAKNKCHPNYLIDYRREENLSESMMDELLSMIEPEDKKLLYDRQISQEIYDKYLHAQCNENEEVNKLLDFIGNRQVLLLGPGKNIRLQETIVKDYINRVHPVTISINYLPPTVPTDCVFITNSKRYHDMTTSLKKCKNRNLKTLATTNVSCKNGKFDFVINRAPLLEKKESIIDNSFLMMIKFLQRIGIREVYCAGFDGYSDKESNYSNPEMEYTFVRREANNLNAHMKRSIAKYRKCMEIRFITYSAYDIEEDIEGGAI